MQTQLYQLVQKNRVLFWSVAEKALPNLDEQSVVESILNFGDENGVRQLFEILGVKRVAEIFYSQINQKRNNYFTPVQYYFEKYFQRHASEHTHPKSN